VQIFFEQGLAGLLAFGILVVIALARLTASAWRGDLFATTLLAALGGFLLVGLFDSLFDAPRLTALFFLLLFLALRRTSMSGAAARRAS
jgi:O-antigen ligase